MDDFVDSPAGCIEALPCCVLRLPKRDPLGCVALLAVPKILGCGVVGLFPLGF